MEDSDEVDVDWNVVERVERDICYLYYLQAEYGGIDGDQAYGVIFNEPYWRVLDHGLDFINEPRRSFVIDGCLVMLIAMAWDVMDASGTYVLPHIRRCVSALDKVPIDDDDRRRLVDYARRALKTAARRERASLEFEELALWLNERYIQEYFRYWAEFRRS